MPLLLAGGVCCCGVEAGFDVEADLPDEAGAPPPELPDAVDEPAGALEGAGAGAGAGAGLELELALEEPDEFEAAPVVPEVEPEAGCEASADVSDFFVRFFLVVVLESAVVDEPVALELDVAAAPDAGWDGASAAASDFFDFFFLVVVELSLAAELSAVAAPEEASASADFLVFFFLVVVEESSLAADCELASAVVSSVVFFFFFFLVVVELSDWLWSVDCVWPKADCAPRTVTVPKPATQSAKTANTISESSSFVLSFRAASAQTTGTLLLRMIAGFNRTEA